MKNRVLVILLTVLFTFLNVNGETETFSVDTREVRGTDITSTLELSGKVISNRELRIKSPFDSVISTVHVIDGEWVTKGEKLLTFSKKSINKVIEQNLTELKKWEKILWQREHWAKREKSAEDSAKKKINKLKEEIAGNRKTLENPVIFSSGEGKILSISSKNEKVIAGSDIVVITDDYVMKVPVPSENKKAFFKGMRLDVKFPEENIKRTGRVGFEGDDLMIFINNPDLKISSGMLAVFSVTTKTKGIILIKREEFKTDSNGRSFVYVLEGDNASKKIINITELKDRGFIVNSGLSIGDMLVTPIADTNAERFLISSGIKDETESGSKSLKITNKPRVKKDSFSLGKKMEYVISAGLSFSKPDSLIVKSSGIDDSISQYSDLFGLTYTEAGVFKENLMGIPVSVTVNYKLSDGLYLKFGGEYSTMSNSSEKSYNVSWPALNENIDYSLKNSVTNLMPFIGIEKRFSSFGIYAVLGLNLTSFSHTGTISMNEGSNTFESIEEIKASGSGIGINLGAKYMIKFKDKFGIFIKLEYAVQTISSFSGDKTTSVSDSIGENYSTTESGTLYLYDIDPYGQGGFGWWDIHDSSPSGIDISNVSDFALKLSRIRFLVGFSF
ncbi:MAG: efflux RND transporter periplasmic adaptor subunit [Acidobacteriota bacterium]